MDSKPRRLFQLLNEPDEELVIFKHRLKYEEKIK